MRYAFTMNQGAMSEIGWAITRFVFGASLAFFHGYGKVFGGRVVGLTRTVGELGIPFPSFFAWAAALSEFAGGILVAVGLATRPAAALCALTMVVALYRHRADPVSRLELPLLFLSVMLFALLHGGGRYALDRFFRLRFPLQSHGGA